MCVVGAAVVHVPTYTTIYIDAGGTYEIHNIMRAELVAIYAALEKFATHEWVGIFTDSLSSLQSIRNRYTNPRTRGSQNYYHHLLLLSGITDLLEERRRQGFRTTLHRNRARTQIRGNDLADAAAETAVTQYDSIPEYQKQKVDIGEEAPRPPHRVMYTVKPPSLYTFRDKQTDGYVVVVDSGGGGRLQMNAFTCPSQQLRRKVTHALLRSLHYTSIYRRLIKKADVGTNTQSVGKAIHRRHAANAWEGTTLLK